MSDVTANEILLSNDYHSLDEWKNSWDADDIGFHESEVLPDLLKHENLFGDHCRIFLPLCGKSLDLVHLADKGHDVFGCEFVSKAVQDFFKEQNLDYTISPLCSEVTVYKATSKKITLYQGDFFNLKSEDIGKFDAIWDRGSFIAIGVSQRMKYVEVMQDLMGSQCKYLMNVFEIIGDTYRGPPHSVLADDLEKLFGSFCTIKFLDEKPSFHLPNLKRFVVVNYFLSKK